MKPVLGILLCCLSGAAGAVDLKPDVNQLYPELFDTYQDFHRYPELSLQEAKTAKKIADKLSQMGFTVTSGMGGHGVVAVLENGPGKTLMLRADMDALPVTEETGVAYASKVKVNNQGVTSGVMHACGHDVHMTSMLGAAQLLVNHKDKWQGTLMLVGQPAEEIGKGARAMLNDGLFEKTPKPDAVFGLHVSASLPAGSVGSKPEYILAGVETIDLTIKGKGGHGAYPHTTVDPIVLASRTVLALQTIASREVNPLRTSVLTVGSIHGGTKHNIISNQVKLELTLRYYEPEVKAQYLEAIERIARGIATSAGLSEELMPVMKVHQDKTIAPTYNDPDLTAWFMQGFRAQLGNDQVHLIEPVMAGEDFGLYGLTQDDIPITMFWLGTVNPTRYQQAQQQGTALPSLHSSLFAPDPEPTLKTGVATLAQSAIAWFSR